MKLEFHPLGMATWDLDETLSAMERVGGCEVLSEPVTDSRQSAKLRIVRWNGVPIEIIAGEGDRNPVEGFLKKGLSVYHICFRTDDLAGARNHFAALGWLEVSGSKPAELFDGKNVLFLFHPRIGIVELLGE